MSRKDYHETCEQAIRQVGGFVSNKFGDGVQALFGYPHAHEDDAERAVRAALAIIRTIGISNSTNKTPLDVRVGIASGDVLIPLSEVKTLVGQTPNRAAHLQAAAEPNSILIADETRQLLTETFLLQRLQVALKGETAPSTVWRVIGETEFREPLRRPCHQSHRLRRPGSGSGPAGRPLAAGDRGRRAGRPAFRGGGNRQIPHRRDVSPGHRQSRRTRRRRSTSARPSTSTVPSIRSSAGSSARRNSPRTIRPTSSSASSRRCSEHSTTRPDHVVPLFAALLSIDDRRPLSRRRTPIPSAARNARSTRSSSVSPNGRAIAPTLVIFEDVHWADPTTLDLLGRMIMRLQELPALLIMTCRPEFKARWIGHPQVTALILNRLGRRHCRAMIESIAGKTMPTDIVDQIVAKTDGVPLFVEELTKNVLEFGLPARQGRCPGAHRSPSPARHSRDPAGFAHGAARPAGDGQGGGADRCRDRPGVLLCAAGGGLHLCARPSFRMR